MPKKLAKIYHTEIFGKRGEKYDFLEKNDLATLQWQELKPKAPYYFFVPKDFSAEDKYKEGFGVDELFKRSNSGVKTDRDSLFIDFNKESLEIKIQKLLADDFDEKFKIDFRVFNSGSYKLKEKISGKIYNEEYVHLIQYRPFDYRWIYYDPSIISRPADKVLKHVVYRDNLVLIFSRQFGGRKHFICFCTKKITEISSQPYAPYTLFPLYLYHEDGTKTANFNQEILEKIKANLSGEVMPEDVLDYIYASLHSPSYREKYKEFLKIDFPRVPYPKNNETFWQLVEKGRELRELHLLESPKLKDFITTFPESGSNVVEKIKYEKRKVFINEKQYFGNVPEIAWNFYVGGYQPAQKWLKDRKGRTLGNEDLEHYQKIIVALAETDRLMKEIG